MADRSKVHAGRCTRASAGSALLKIILCLFLSSQGLRAQAQPAASQPRPLTSDTIANYLKARLSPVRIVSLIQKDHVNFHLSRELETSFRSLGASDQILKALRDNYAADPSVVEHPKQESSAAAAASSVQPSQPAADSSGGVPGAAESASAPATGSQNAVSLQRRPPDVAIASAPAASTGPDDTTIYNVGRDRDVTAPVPIYTPAPDYSESGRKASLSGVVVVEVIVDRQGNVRDAQVVNKSSPQLDEKVLEAVRSWRFKPGMWNGQAVVTRERINVLVHR